MLPIISVIIPFYNNHNTLHETLTSCLNSTYENFEIIVIDDGSKYSPIDIISNIMSEKIRLITQKNKGVSNARNNGVKQAVGEYLFFLDSDDLIDASYLEKAAEILDKNKNIKLVTAKALQFSSTFEKKWNLPEPTLERILFSNCIHISTLIRKKDFDSLNGFDETMPAYEDWDFWIRLINTDNEIFQIKEELFRYRIHGNDHTNLSKIYFENSNNRKQLEDYVFKKNAEKIITYFGHPFLYKREIGKFNSMSWYRKLFRRIRIK